MRRTVRGSVEKSIGLFLCFGKGSGLYPFTAALFETEGTKRRLRWIVLQYVRMDTAAFLEDIAMENPVGSIRRRRNRKNH